MNVTIREETYKNRKSIPLLVELIKPLLSPSFSKGDMVKEIERFEGKELNIDYAIPWEFQKALIDLNLDPTFIVWDYSSGSMGKPINLIQRYFQAFCKVLDD